MKRGEKRERGEGGERCFIERGVSRGGILYGRKEARAEKNSGGLVNFFFCAYLCVCVCVFFGDGASHTHTNTHGRCALN